jgi:hypothetical protein
MSKNTLNSILFFAELSFLKQEHAQFHIFLFFRSVFRGEDAADDCANGHENNSARHAWHQRRSFPHLDLHFALALVIGCRNGQIAH